MKILLRGENSDNRVALLEDEVPPDWDGPPLHHHGWDEAFYVLAGELTFQLADQFVTRGAGEVAFAPRGVHHTFANLSDAPAAYLVVCTPAGSSNISTQPGPGLQTTSRSGLPWVRPSDRERGAADRVIDEVEDLDTTGTDSDLVDEKTEGMIRRVEVDTYIVLWLVVGQPRSDVQRVSPSLIQVVDANVQVQHLLLFAGSFRPHGGPVVHL